MGACNKWDLANSDAKDFILLLKTWHWQNENFITSSPCQLFHSQIANGIITFISGPTRCRWKRTFTLQTVTLMKAISFFITFL